MTVKIKRQSKECRGCRVCEIMCSYHFRRVFSPGGGAIKVLKNNQTGEISWYLSPACDLCKAEVSPLCLKYCNYRALSMLRLG